MFNYTKAHTNKHSRARTNACTQTHRLRRLHKHTHTHTGGSKSHHSCIHLPKCQFSNWSHGRLADVDANFVLNLLTDFAHVEVQGLRAAITSLWWWWWKRARVLHASQKYGVSVRAVFFPLVSLNNKNTRTLFDRTRAGARVCLWS